LACFGNKNELSLVSKTTELFIPESGEGGGGPEEEDVTYYTNSQSPINLPPHGWTTADLEHATIGESAYFLT